MNLYTNIFLCIIYITYPLLMFLFYVAYNRNYCKEENNLFLDVALISSFYLIIKFTNPIFGYFPPIILNVPLVIAYLKKRNITIFLLSIMSVICYTQHFDLNFILIIIEYITYFFLYLSLINQKNYDDKYINAFIIVKSFFFTLISVYSNFYTGDNYIEFFAQILILILILYLTIYFTTLLFEKGEEIIKYHMSLKELEQSKQIQNSLFKITHEIKNPIAVCKGYLDMFDTNNPEHSTKYVPILREEIERVLLLLQDFLSITRVNIEKEAMDIYLLIEDITDDFRPILKNKNIKLDLKVPDDELYISGDYNRLKQVILNIIKNSIEAIPSDRQGFIKIYTKKIKNKVNIYIADNGVGMDKEALKHLNEPFFTTKCNGTGLGVTLSSEIIGAHDGKINYSSVEGQGTTVEIILNCMN